MSLRTQLENIDPSVPDALFRRLMVEDDLNYLRHDGKITGFEVDLDKSEELSGYAIIAIQKHTILAFRSDLDADMRLILFPSMDKLDDPAFDLLDLTVRRKVFSESSFSARIVSEGHLSEVAKDLIPPFRQVEIDDQMAADMRHTLQEDAFDVQTPNKPAPSHTDDPDDDADDAPFEPNKTTVTTSKPTVHVSEPKPEKEPEDKSEGFKRPTPSDPRGSEMQEQTFNALSEVADYTILHFGLDSSLANSVTMAALNASKNEKTQIEVAKLLFIKIFNDGKA